MYCSTSYNLSETLGFTYRPPAPLPPQLRPPKPPPEDPPPEPPHEDPPPEPPPNSPLEPEPQHHDVHSLRIRPNCTLLQ